MKKRIRYKQHNKEIEKEITYIPVRYVIAAMLVILEVLAMIGAVVALCYFVPYLYILAYLVELGCIIKLLSAEDNPDYKVPWLIIVLLLPVVGFMLYIIFYSRKLKRKYVKRLAKLQQEVYPTNDDDILDKLKAENVQAYSQAKMLINMADTHIFTNTAQTYFPSGEAMFESMLVDLKSAENFIYLEYFIIEEGEFWNPILSILADKAKSGLDIKVVYDDIGCMKTLPGSYWKVLKKYGIKATPFSRVKGQANNEFNNRNHRKIMVIDGKIGYTGGINLADEYINAKTRFGHWRDGGIRLEGPAVYEMTKLFTIDYGINVKEMPFYHKDRYPIVEKQAKGYIVPFGDGPKPIYDRCIAKAVIQNMLAMATKEVLITTPYFVIDNELCMSFENTALRGVKIKIVLPHIPDKKFVFNMSRSFYARLINAGIEVYEYERGFMHAKNYIVDGKIAMIGSINLDYRSLVHHFENAVWMYDTECIKDALEDFNQIVDESILMTPEMVKMSPFRRLIRAIVKIFAPLM